MSVTTSEEMTFTIRLSGEDKFDLTYPEGRTTRVDRLTVQCVEGRLMEITAAGALYRDIPAGTIGSNRNAISIAGREPADLSLGYNLHWTVLPTAVQERILRWCESRGQKA